MGSQWQIFKAIFQAGLVLVILLSFALTPHLGSLTLVGWLQVLWLALGALLYISEPFR